MPAWGRRRGNPILGTLDFAKHRSLKRAEALIVDQLKLVHGFHLKVLRVLTFQLQVCGIRKVIVLDHEIDQLFYHYLAFVGLVGFDAERVDNITFYVLKIRLIILPWQHHISDSGSGGDW